MMRAATVSIFLVLRMRPEGRSGSSSASPRTSGIMLTPVSKPESPSARRGNTKSDTPIIVSGLP
jgi:hypothetical protein